MLRFLPKHSHAPVQAHLKLRNNLNFFFAHNKHTSIICSLMQILHSLIIKLSNNLTVCFTNITRGTGINGAPTSVLTTWNRATCKCASISIQETATCSIDLRLSCFFRMFMLHAKVCFCVVPFFVSSFAKNCTVLQSARRTRTRKRVCRTALRST